MNDTSAKQSKIEFEKISRSDLDIANSQEYVSKFKKGVDKKIIQQISNNKSEPLWMLDIRLKALELFEKMDFPTWGPDLSMLDFHNIRYFTTASENSHARTWENVDPEIKKTFERLRIPQAERAVLAGVGAQYESENVYHNLKKEWEDQGVIFEDFDIAVKKYPDLVQKYFSKCVSVADHKFAALHYAVTSGGTFLFVPKGIKITQPLQAYFRMNSMNQGQFEHTLIVVEDGADVHYIEGCSAPKYGSQSLHAGCVEIFVGKNAAMRYSSVENWSKDTYNLNTKRAIINENGRMEWIGGNLGSGITMLYPCSILTGNGAQADHLGVTFANQEQNQDTGAKVMIQGKHCQSNIISKSLSKGGGISTYRGIISIAKTATDATVNVECDALMLDDISVSDTIPQINCENNSSFITHEASAGKISEEVLLYFQSRGIDEETAKGIIVNGFLNEIVKTLPLEYAVELNRLIELEMEGSIG
jgi:Fe-S cluster assembly protein SufB